MFNPYAVRPIGSRQFEEHLKDIQTDKWYEQDYGKDMGAEDLMFVHGYLPWDDGTVPDVNPWRKLWIAIVTLTVIDYLDIYLKRNECLFQDDEPGYWVQESMCLDLENNFFRRGEFTELIFDKLLANVCWMGDEEIIACKKRMNRVLQWALYEE